jgi:hypothetical protein
MSTWVSTSTVLSLLVGLAVSAVYLRYMWLALQRAVRTRSDPDEGVDRFRFGLAGAVIAVVGSAAAISAYGIGPALLYAGPALAIASALAVSFCLRGEALDD